MLLDQMLLFTREFPWKQCQKNVFSQVVTLPKLISLSILALKRTLRRNENNVRLCNVGRTYPMPLQAFE